METTTCARPTSRSFRRDVRDDKAGDAAIAELLEAETHEAVVSRLAKALRSGKVLVDWSQNTEHKSMVLRLLSTGEAASDGLDADHLGRG
jgi:DNA primase